MPTNAEILASFDADDRIASNRIAELDSSLDEEHGAQTVCFEMLRELVNDGTGPEQWAEMTDPQFEAWLAARRDAAVAAAQVYNATRVNGLDPGRIEQAANIGLNYYEHTYDQIMENVGDDITTFRKSTSSGTVRTHTSPP